MLTETKDKKTIKLSNWNVFLLDRLNQMYSKGEMCDVTLKFHDEQSIQGHKLILAACTTIFNNLPTSAAEVVLNMPKNIKSLHVRPLINFLYSGRLEYMNEDHDNVLHAAKHLGISVLTELMQVQQNPTLQRPGTVKPIKKYGQKPTTPQPVTPPSIKCEVSQPPADVNTTPRILPGKKLPFWKKRKTIQVPDEFFQSVNVNTKPLPLELPTPTRFACSEEDILPEIQIKEVDLNGISYDCKVLMKPVSSPKPVITEDSILQIPPTKPTPPPLTPPVLKRPRVSEVVRSRDDDDDYDDGHFETIHDLDDYNDEDDPPKLSDLKPLTTPPKPILKTHETGTPTPTKKVRFSISDKFTSVSEESKTPSTSASESVVSHPFTNSASISITTPVTTSGGQPTSINHAKIINEVLKKFPHMVKNNKNIKLKIQTGGNLPVPFTPTPGAPALEAGAKGQTKVQYVVLKSDFASVKKEIKTENPAGAENTTGPWTCVSCGDQSGPKHFESYYTYRKHLQEIHNERIDARICEHCGFKASKRNLHLYHLYTKHNVPPPRNVNFPKCDQCNYIALSESLLIKHRSNHTNLFNKEYVCRVCNASFKSNGALTGHMQTNLHHMEQLPKKDYECEFCGKIFNRNINLKAHIRTSHQEENRKMYEDEDRIDSPAETKIAPEQRNQNVMEVIEVPVYDSMPNNKTFYLHQEMTILAESPSVPLMPSSESEAMNNVATGIATSINIADRNIPNDVIVINENSEIILRGTPTTYVVNQDGSYSLQEYIVPEIMGDTRQMYTTALVSSAPTTGISYVNSDNLSIITSGTDHTYADGTKINGQVSTGSQVNLVSSNGPTVIASQVSQADPRIIVQEPIIVSGDWVQTLGAQQAQALTLAQGQKFELISAPAVTQLNNAVQVSLPGPDNTSKVSDASQHVDGSAQLRTAQTLVSDWGDGDDDTQEEESQDEDSEMKPSRPTLELAENHELI